MDSHCLPVEKMLTAASKDIDEIEERSSSVVEPDGGLELQDCGSVMGGGETEDFSENEDTETNSEGKSESTVINLLKSIESSTDTLVAEIGVVSEFCGNRRSVVGVNLKTDHLECSSDEFSCKTERENLAEISETRIFQDNGLEVSVNGYYSLATRDKSQEVIELTNGDKSVKCELNQNDIDMDGTQPCEVCASSSKLLKGHALINGSATNGSSSSSYNNIVSSNSVHAMPSTAGNSSGYGSKFSSYNTPMHSRTPSTGIPATPEESSYQLRNGYQEKWTSDVPTPAIGPGPGTTNNTSYDVDGLAPLRDEVQSRVNVIVSSCMVSYNALILISYSIILLCCILTN